ncbi:hypothetical protein DID88_010170 [Monilinia fructigena]|uniref:P-type ATPase N-terminal domain-containing protein n=1 Tax=Monilinia fructigena TaxID=38457 RepID=A0A395IKP9_9HELO|nr:hypothetical protein DID88_010170 [Monilinia fructigena]
MYFLLVALSQAIPPLRIGYLSTYIVPLVFVLAITLGKEAFDDIGRRRRDAEANSEGYTVLCFDQPSKADTDRYSARKKLKSKGKSKKGKSLLQPDRLSDIQEEEESAESQGRDAPSSIVREVIRKSRDLKVGDVFEVREGSESSADVVILKTDSAGVGETFIRTDQLDGETDWKLRLGSPLTQSLDPSEFVRLSVVAGKPDKKVNEFIGTVSLLPKGTDGYDRHMPKEREIAGDDEQDGDSAPLTIDNTAWANTVLASSATTLAVIVYTGPQTRSALSTSPSRSKTGLLENEINSLTKILCALTLTLSIVLVALEGFEHVEGVQWYVKIMRFLVLFSTIVPISLRVNLDMERAFILLLFNEIQVSKELLFAQVLYLKNLVELNIY